MALNLILLIQWNDFWKLRVYKILRESKQKSFFLLFHAIPNNIKSSLTTTPDKFDNRLFANITNRRDKKQNNTERKTYISKTLSRAEIEKYTYNQALQERASFQALFPIGPKFLFYPSLYYLVQHRFLPLS